MSNEGNIKVFNSKKFGMVLCEKHYAQMEKHGEILERTNNDPNEIIRYDDHAEIVLYSRSNQEIARAIIDTEDIDKIKDYKWSLCNSYARTTINNKTIMLHRIIMDCPEEMVTDHISHNTLDNRKCNLRICSIRDNLKNRKKHKDNSSGYTGVSIKTRGKKYRAEITYNGNYKHLGSYDVLEDAVAARKKAEDEYFGEFVYKESDDSGVKLWNPYTKS